MAGRLDGTPDVKRRRQRIAEVCKSLPDAQVEPVGAGHLAFKVKNRIFGYYSYDHHGDGVIALLCKAPPGEQGRLVAEQPTVYFVPGYLGSKGWIGIRLDTARVDWADLKDHLLAAWLMTAPAGVRKEVQTSELAEPAQGRRRRTRG